MNIDQPYEIAPKVWWVGYVIPNDPFQCHVYLIENEDESILIDPGSKITWEVTRQKIEKITPLKNIKYIICHHQDPDITSCIGDLFKEIGTKNRFIVTHWRTSTLLKHYNWGVKFYNVDEHNWKLKAKDIELEFIFTPYMHFPGAICTYDKKNQILFSSDIFGAFTEEFSLFAKDAKKYFEQMKPFHTHYMPSREIVNFGLDNIEKYPLKMIAPQHGSIIPQKMISYIIKRLRQLDVGIYLHFTGVHDVKRLTKAHEVITTIFEKLSLTQSSIYDHFDTFFTLIQEIIPLKRVICLAHLDESFLIFDSQSDIPRELLMEENEFFQLIDGLTKTRYTLLDKIADIPLKRSYLAYSFKTLNERQFTNGVCLFLFEEDEEFNAEDREILKNLQKLFNIMLLKELSYYKIQKEKKELLEKIITDALTGLYNRYYLDDIGPKEFQKAKRHHYSLSVAMIDLDHFKKINDTYGHDIGDIVLRDFAKILKHMVRESDFVFRYGGEEFLIVMPFTDRANGAKILERIREYLHRKSIHISPDLDITYTFSAGIAQAQESDRSLNALIKRADEALYEAKKAGRDKIIYK